MTHQIQKMFLNEIRLKDRMGAKVIFSHAGPRLRVDRAEAGFCRALYKA